MIPGENSPTWRPFPLEADDAGLPPLIVSTCFSNSSYAVHLSDMTNTWSETLDRRAVIMRGFQEDTSIDPSDGDNMRALLNKLRDGFDSCRPGHSKTRLSLAPHDGKPTGEDGLVLTVKYTFPPGAGLQPLVWPLYLKKCPSSRTTTELILPLCRVHYAQSQELDALTKALAEKDAVITKLLDKLDNMGVGLENVFSSLPVKRKVTRAVAENRINGLAPFDRPGWTSQFNGRVESPTDTDALIRGVFGGTGVRYEPPKADASTRSTHAWWQTIGTIMSFPIRSDPGPGTNINTSPLPTKSAEVEDNDDDFQAQVTRPRLTKPLATTRHPVKMEKTKDGDDFQAQSTPHRLRIGQRGGTVPAKPEDDVSTEDDDPGLLAPPKAVVQQPRRKRLGAIRGKATAKSPSPPIPQQAEAGPESETASEVASETEDAPTKQPSPPASRPGRRRLGQLGGRMVKEVSPAPDTTETPTTHPPTHDTSSSNPTRDTAPRRLGAIGKRHAIQDQPGSDPRGRTRTPGTAAANQRETSEERANRRRQELEKGIAAKAAAPARKKRKF
ncbi:hypothetical protein MKZ38_000088 [Zalerion maritima]|uniref:Non-homologous end-joining factor 1 n=1 Tax=Zalerion maritima TaxID=339359 RepID=A0AAD5RSR4_9PEZI|nr:hypothetical protein MKZ38_000088 [Zalerion maritima]